MSSIIKTRNNQSTKINSDAGQRIRLLRKIMGLNQKELGQEIGVTQQQVQKYESGHVDITLSRLEEISDVLKTEPASLITSDNEDIENTILHNEKALKSAIIAKKIETLPMDTIDKLAELITALSEFPKNDRKY